MTDQRLSQRERQQDRNMLEAENGAKRNDLPLFPIPSSGHTRVDSLSARTFLVECTRLGKSDYERLMGFFNQMAGRFGAFRFEYRTINLPQCHFASDQLTSEQIGPGLFRFTLPIEAAPR
jgi:hypothetical protein